jgi:hypothetical protein
MQLSLSKEEQQLLIAAIDSAIKHAPSSLQASAALLPLASKINDLKEDEPKAES